MLLLFYIVYIFKHLLEGARSLIHTSVNLFEFILNYSLYYILYFFLM